MKEASGELNMTLITIIAVAAVLAIFFAIRPMLNDTINNTWSQTESQYEDAVNY